MDFYITDSAWMVIPMFHSRSISSTIHFYIRKLCFKLASVKPEGNETELFFAPFLWAEKRTRMFTSRATAEAFKPSQAMIALSTSDYYEHVKEFPEVEIVEDIESMPCGLGSLQSRIMTGIC